MNCSYPVLYGSFSRAAEEVILHSKKQSRMENGSAFIQVRSLIWFAGGCRNTCAVPKQGRGVGNEQPGLEGLVRRIFVYLELSVMCLVF